MLMVSPSKMRFDQFAALGQAEELRQGPGRRKGLQPLHGAGRKNQHAMRGLAAERLLPGESRGIELCPIEILGESGGRRVANRQALAIGRDPIGIGNPHAGCRSVPGEDDVIVEIGASRDRQSRHSPRQRRGHSELQLLDDVDDPAFAEGFPGEHIDAALAEQGP